ncbi:transcriptional regulator GcvA [uncultured Roseovarius sp.]|uniref:transcriptional regulator GcvA n=1 Tax=uncultured Roseovarius sp. TaxID=293344 RepID=UPI00260D6354|nr:transcriptional regulator GcvA [uncultured Roseovarius sp.]
MNDRLPPLTALRAFDAAARHMSFQQAAAELNVTPAALSFQIKSLEEHFGGLLFIRHNRAVELTEAGRALAPGARDGFETLVTAWCTARRVTDHASLTITTGPSFTAIWLAPRLYSFARAHPDIELRFSASLSLVDLTHSEVDIAIRFGYGPDNADLHAEKFLDDWVTPMMSPELAEKFPKASDMAGAQLIHQDDIRFLDPPCDWPAWFRAAGLSPRDWTGQRYSQADHAIDAAMSGAGVILGRGALAARALKEGRLVAPYKVALKTIADYRIICEKGAENRPQIVAFRDWLIEQTTYVAELAHDHDLIDLRDVSSA